MCNKFKDSNVHPMTFHLVNLRRFTICNTVHKRRSEARMSETWCSVPSGQASLTPYASLNGNGDAPQFVVVQRLAHSRFTSSAMHSRASLIFSARYTCITGACVTCGVQSVVERKRCAAWKNGVGVQKTSLCTPTPFFQAAPEGQRRWK